MLFFCIQFYIEYCFSKEIYSHFESTYYSVNDIVTRTILLIKVGKLNYMFGAIITYIAWTRYFAILSKNQIKLKLQWKSCALLSLVKKQKKPINIVVRFCGMMNQCSSDGIICKANSPRNINFNKSMPQSWDFLLGKDAIS